MLHPLLRFLLTAALVFPALLLAVNLLFALLLGGLPNGVQLEATANLAFLKILWQDNPWETLKLVLFDKPLVVIEQRDHEMGLQLWGTFYFAGTVLVYLLVSAFTAWHWRALIHSSAKQRALFVAGAMTALGGATYLKLAACCTNGTSWLLESWMLAKVYTPNPGPLNWELLYQRMQPWLPILQTGMLVGAMAMLYWWYLITKGRVASASRPQAPNRSRLQPPNAKTPDEAGSHHHLSSTRSHI